MALSAEQESFLNHPPSKCGRLLAGPGTGKSFTSVAYLEKITNENPQLRVGYITFTRAATAEFAKKLNDSGLTALGGRPPKTMHGFSLSLLLSHHSTRIPYPLRIPDSWEVKFLIHPDVCRLLRAKGYNEATPTLATKLEAELASGFQSLSGAVLPLAASSPDLTNAYRGVWRQHRTQYGYTLLSELPYQAAGVLSDVDETELDLDLVIVDEFQDLNNADQQVLEKLAEKGIAVIAIGDDDQSIYSWRNAAPDGIRQFATTFSTDYDYPLTVSQRCGGDALKAANNLIEQDSLRPQKARLVPSDRAPQTQFKYLRFRNGHAEARGAAAIAAARIAAGVAPGDIGILVRSSLSTWASGLQPALTELGVVLGSTVDISTILADSGVRTALALGQLIANRGDSLAWRSLLQVTPGIGPSVVDYVYQSQTTGSFADRLIALHQDGFPGFRGSSKLLAMMNFMTGTLDGVDVDVSAGINGGWAAWLIAQIGEAKFASDALVLFLAVGDQLASDDRLSIFVSEFEPTAKPGSTADCGV
jgi:DNA helicase-2/ATP-dependent DNA helicase PcrA